MNKIEQAKQAFEKLCRAAHGEYYIGKPNIQLIREVLNSAQEDKPSEKPISVNNQEASDKAKARPPTRTRVK